MDSFDTDIDEYRRQMQKGAIPRAYRGIFETMLALRAHFKTVCPDYIVSGSLYPGYMDMTYFAIVPPAFKQRDLKVAVVFLHPTVSFEAWLSAVNRKTGAHYWQLIRESGWQRYPLASESNSDAILTHVLAGAPDFRDLPALIAQIETETLGFIADVESFLAGSR